MMKALALATLFLAAQISAAATNLGIKCELMDYSKPNPTVQRQAYNVPIGQTLTISAYRGLIFEASASTVNTPNLSGYKITLGARNATTMEVVGRASTVFQTEMPDLTFQDGDNFFLHCISADKSF